MPGLWGRLADLCVPPWTVGLSSMPGRDRVACVDLALQHARLTGFPSEHPTNRSYVVAGERPRHLRALPDPED